MPCATPRRSTSQVKAPDGKPAATADVAFAAVDEALLQLAPNDSWDVLDAMMGERPLSVLTSTAQMQVVGKRHYGSKAVEAGGGGGGDLSGLNRENFQPVLLWKGRVALDAQGPCAGRGAAVRCAVVLQAGRDRDRRRAICSAPAWPSVRTAQDLSIYRRRCRRWCAPATVIGASFTLRNGIDKPMKVTATVDVDPARRARASR